METTEMGSKEEILPGRNQCIARSGQKDHATRNVTNIGPTQACVVLSNVLTRNLLSNFIMEGLSATL